MKRLLQLVIVLLVVASPSLAQTTTTFRPNADGATEQWTNDSGTACTGTTCFSQVNETTGAVNCTGSATVKGSNVLNKTAATTGLIQTYTLDLSSLTNNTTVIDSIVVHTCEKRGAGTNATGRLRINVNGGTTTCGSNQTATSAYQDLSCTFSAINVTKGSGTTIEIGNETRAAQIIFMDVIEAEITTHQIQAGAAAVTGHFSPAVTAVRGHPANEAITLHSDVPCCVLTDSPLAVTVHTSPAVTAVKSQTNQVGNVSASVQLSPGIAVPRALHVASSAAVHVSPTVTAQKAGPQVGNVAAAFHSDVPCCAVTDSPLAAAVHFSPVVNAVRQGNTVASVSAGLTLGTGATATGVGSIARAGAASVHADAPCCAITDSPLSAAVHVSPAVTATGHGNVPRGATAVFTTAPVCQACVSEGFQATSFNTIASATRVRGANGGPAAAPHFSLAVTVQLGLNRPVAQGLTTSPVSTNQAAHFAAVTSSFHIVPGVNITAPGAKAVSVSAGFTITPVPDESSIVSSGATATLHFSLTDTASKNVTKSPTASAHFGLSVTGQVAASRNIVQGLQFSVVGRTGQSNFSGGGIVTWHIGPAATAILGHNANVIAGLHFSTADTGAANRFGSVSVALHVTPVISNNNQKLVILVQAAHVNVQVNIGQTVSRLLTQAMHFSPIATASIRTPGNEKAVMVVTD